jgi:hypothetical protein
MPVAVTIDIPGGNEQFYEQMVAKLFPDGKLPEGWLVHLAGPTESGWRVVNVGLIRFSRPRVRLCGPAAGRWPR